MATPAENGLERYLYTGLINKVHDQVGTWTRRKYVVYKTHTRWCFVIGIYLTPWEKGGSMYLK